MRNYAQKIELFGVQIQNQPQNGYNEPLRNNTSYKLISATLKW